MNSRDLPSFLAAGGLWVALIQSATSADEVAEIGGSARSAAESSKAFSIEQQEGAFWLVRPNGRRFFSFGVCCVNQGASPETFDPENPAYAAWQHYGNGGAWARDTLQRLESWRFTTIGGWSDFQTLQERREADFGFTPVLSLGAGAGAPWWDMWDPKNIERMDQRARDAILPLREDPRIIGYFSDNELGWWNAALFKMTLEQPPTSTQRQRLIQLLRETYADDWSRLAQDFEPEGAENWTDLSERGMLFLRPQGKGIHVMRRFLGLMAERYYSLVHDIIRKYDRRALVLGDRYQSFYYPEVARAASRHVDVISTNLNAAWNDGTFPRFFLETLHQLTGKPILVSEFYMAARQNRSGNKNDHGVFPVVRTQSERAAGFQKTLRELVRLPFVIGADWFQYADEPGHGRFDGENFNFGLIDIRNRPYEPLVSNSSQLELTALKTQARPPPRPDASQGVPRAPRDPLGQFTPMLALRGWDRERGFVPPVSDFPLADLFVCWNQQAVYLGLYAQDVVEDAYYRDRTVPKSDRAEWIVAIEGDAEPIRVRLGAGAEPISNQPLRVVNLSGLNLDVRNIAAMQLTAKRFGQKRFKAGETIAFASTLFSHGQAQRAEWKARLTLR